LADCQIKVAEKIKVIANVDAQYYNNHQQVRQGLVNQLIMPIRWQKCMEKLLADGVESFYEIGPGRVLTGLMKRIHRKTKVVNLSKAESVNMLTSEVAAG
jgi:[acyl-carrier-protein] S-malonyltransferase